MGTSLPLEASGSVQSSERSWSPATDSEREEVRQQLERLVSDEKFAASKRYPRLLRYVVEETLAGRAEQLKERTLGVEVFGRGLAYDTDRDPVIRTSAAQIRQRLTQYYQEPRHEGEIRIELFPGSYIPQFHYPGRPAGPTATSAGKETVPIDAPVAAAPAVARKPARAALWLGLAAAGILACAGLARWVTAPGPVEKFWGPVWDKTNPIVICAPGKFPTVESVAGASGDYARTEPLSIHESLRLNVIAWPDATTLYALVGVIRTHGQAYQVRRAGDTALSDLRNGPSILIGGLNNPWLMRLSRNYRFSYRNDSSAGRAWIVDSQHPERHDRQVEWTEPYPSFDEDYGIISRVWDPTTERIVVTASGIASYGTIAASEFLTNPKYLEMIAEQAPAGWERKSVQVVFSTKVFNGNAGPPRILAIHVW